MASKTAPLNKIETINKNRSLVEAKIDFLIENGRIEITSKAELEEHPIGSLISYMNNNNIFKSCGFLTKICDDYFIYIKPDFESKFKVRYDNIKKMWVGDVYKVKQDIVSITKSSKQETKYKVIIDDIVVYYANDKSDYRRYTHTQKYKTMVKWSEFFTDPEMN